MEKPHKPTNENERLKKLQSYEVLDTYAENEYDDLTKIASEICQTPVCLISLIDKERQWFKSKQGLDATETPRDLAFCAHAIHQTKPFIVEDARQDERFSDNPLVTDAPNVIFYAGTPLLTPEGYALGTLCVIDHQPRKLSSSQIETLEALGRQVVALLELRLKNKQLSQAIKIKSQILSSTTHEIRTPLNGMLGLTNLLIESERDQEKLTDLNQIKYCGESLLQLLNDLLDLSKIEQDKILIEKEGVAVFEEVQSILNIISSTPEANQLSFHLEKEESFPAVIKTDGHRLKQILFNLIGNAVKFTPEQGKVSVRLSFDKTKKEIQIAISDTGIGISEDRQEQIFEEFIQESSGIQRNYGGTGLGLPISRKLARLLGGNITLISKKGEGSTFTLHLNADLGDLKKERKENQPDFFDLETLQKKILIVDDNKINLNLLRRLVHKLGFKDIDNAASAPECYQLLKEKAYDLIFMDVQMPDINGIEATREIRLHNKDVFIIGLSANTEIEYKKKAKAVGMNDYLEKPLKKREISSVLYKYLFKNNENR